MKFDARKFGPHKPGSRNNVYSGSSSNRGLFEIVIAKSSVSKL